jgi:hypothetical protein
MKDERIVDLEDRLERLEQRQGALERSRRMASAAVPPETRQHLRAAGREQLLAVRTLLDHWIRRMDPQPDEARSERETIRIE